MSGLEKDAGKFEMKRDKEEFLCSSQRLGFKDGEGEG